MAYFNNLKVYDLVSRSEILKTGGKLIGVRWVDVNKGDSTDRNYRSVLVGREFNVGKDDTLYASTPPLEALRVITSHAATEVPGEERRQMIVCGVARAYFYAKIERDVFIELPQEDPNHQIWCANCAYAYTAHVMLPRAGKRRCPHTSSAWGSAEAEDTRVSSITRSEVWSPLCTGTTTRRPAR